MGFESWLSLAITHRSFTSFNNIVKGGHHLRGQLVISRIVGSEAVLHPVLRRWLTHSDQTSSFAVAYKIMKVLWLKRAEFGKNSLLSMVAHVVFGSKFDCLDVSGFCSNVIPIWIKNGVVNIAKYKNSTYFCAFLTIANTCQEAELEKFNRRALFTQTRAFSWSLSWLWTRALKVRHSKRKQIKHDIKKSTYQDALGTLLKVHWQSPMLIWLFCRRKGPIVK